MDVIGTFDRIHLTPYRFGCSIVPACSVDYVELVSHARMVGSVLLKRGVVGYVMIDFMVYKDTKALRILGYDVRINAYPSLLYNTYMTLCAGFNEETGKMNILKNIGDGLKPSRWAVVQSAVSHPGLGGICMKDIKRICFDQGMFFDLFLRTGFKFMFFDSPAKGKNFAITAALSPETALKQMEKSYSFLVKMFGQKVGSDTGSSMARSLLGIRKYLERIFPQLC
jgi:hypothetical protein